TALSNTGSAMSPAASTACQRAPSAAVACAAPPKTTRMTAHSQAIGRSGIGTRSGVLMKVTGGSAERCQAEAIWHCCADHVQSGAVLAGREARIAMTSTLAEKSCTACRSGIPPLAREVAEEYRREAPDWALLDDAGRIERTYRFRNFTSAFAFVEHAAALAEAEGHHPD